MFDRRSFLALCCASPLALALARAEAADAECRRPLPPDLAQHDLVAAAWDGLDPLQVWDAHAHLVGTGDADSGAYVNPRTQSWRHPTERIRRMVMMAAACVDDAPEGGIDQRYVERLLLLLAAMPAGMKMLLFAFDHAVDDDGRVRPDLSTFHTPNRYAAAVASRWPQRFEWVGSVHPYREDAIERLERAIGMGARAIKWLPSSMNIDPASARCDAFYRRLARADLPLVIHCGEEIAAPGARQAQFNNPLRVRRPLEHGVRVVIAHVASLGHARDTDALGDGVRVRAFDLFARLMDDARYERLLFGDLSAVFQRNRDIDVQRRLLIRRHWHGRLLHGSDYPLPGIGLVYSLGRFVDAGWLRQDDAAVLDRMRRYNPLLFEFVLKRTLAANGNALAPAVFHTRAFFTRGHG
jgi:predicted TIM-barrel fold metal-dependent hydrolase